MVSSTDEIIKGSAKLGVPKGKKKISTKTDKQAYHDRGTNTNLEFLTGFKPMTSRALGRHAIH